MSVVAAGPVGAAKDTHVHADVAHLLFNLLTFYYFAFPLQRVIGPGHFAALYLIALILSNTGTYLKRRREPEYACLGASGAILVMIYKM